MKKITLSKPKRQLIVRAILCLFGLLVLLITMPVNSYAFDTAVIDWAITELCGHITGYLGALLTGVAVLGAIVSAALGSYRVFFGAIIVAVGAFATPDILEFYFPAAAAKCTPAAGTKSAEVLQVGAPTTEVESTPLKLPTTLQNSTNIAPPVTAPANPDAEDDDSEISRSWGNLTSEE